MADAIDDEVRVDAQRLDLVSARAWSTVVDRLGGARILLLGGLGLGAHQACRARSQLTARLVEEHGCEALLIETDACAAVRLDRFVRGADDDDATRALAGITDPAATPWRCAEVALLLGWLRARNLRRAALGRTVIAGLDVLGLHPIATALLHTLDRTDPGAAARLRRRLSRLELGVADPGPLAATPSGPALTDRRRARALARSPDEIGLWLASLGDAADDDAPTFATALLRDADAAAALRLAHMAALVDAWLGRLGPNGRLVLWTTDRHAALSAPLGHGLGALLRQRHGDAVRAIGFCAHSGAVRAARCWGGTPQVRRLGAAATDGWEQRLHQTGLGDLALDTAAPKNAAWCSAIRPLRVVGAVTSAGAPEPSVPTPLTGCYDTLVHLDVVTPSTPLDTSAPVPQAPSARAPTRTLARAR